MTDRYEIVLEKGGWHVDGYVGPWEMSNKTTFYSDFREAFITIKIDALNSRI